MLGFSEAGGNAWFILQMLGFSEAGGNAWFILQMLGFSEAGGTLHLNEGHVLSQYQFRLFYLQMPDYQH